VFLRCRNDSRCPLHVHIPPLPSLYQGKNESQGPPLFPTWVKKGSFPTDLLPVRKIGNTSSHRPGLAPAVQRSQISSSDISPPHPHTLLLPTIKGNCKFHLVAKRDRNRKNIQRKGAEMGSLFYLMVKREE